MRKTQNMQASNTDKNCFTITIALQKTMKNYKTNAAIFINLSLLYQQKHIIL